MVRKNLYISYLGNFGINPQYVVTHSLWSIGISKLFPKFGLSDYNAAVTKKCTEQDLLSILYEQFIPSFRQFLMYAGRRNMSHVCLQVIFESVQTGINLQNVKETTFVFTLSIIIKSVGQTRIFLCLTLAPRIFSSTITFITGGIVQRTVCQSFFGLTCD